ncbi:MAG: RNase adapter RapZ [Evtepia sp.]
MSHLEFLIISGLSGAGKSSIAASLEDIGFYCVDNLPVSLIPEFAALCRAGTGNYNRVALVTDIRGGQTFDGLFKALDALHEMDFPYKILFVDASDEAIVNRYKETRHNHPLTRQGYSLVEAVHVERVALEPVRRCASHIINTTALSQGKLRGEILRLFGGGTIPEAMSVSVISFGFKYGIPIEADLLFDVRFLPNPFYIPLLRPCTGLDASVRSFLFDYQQTHDFLRHLESLLSFLLPQYLEEGKPSLVIAVGCTGGRHRSVAITREIAEFIRQKGYHTSENHRDMTRG